MNSAVRIVNTTDATSDDLRDFLRESLSLLPAHVQLEILNAVQEAEPLCNEHSLLNHAALLVLLARMSAMQARAAQAGRSAV